MPPPTCWTHCCIPLFGLTRLTERITLQQSINVADPAFWESCCRAGSEGSGSEAEEEAELGPEKVFLVGVAVKQRQKRYGYSIDESLEELARLAETAGLEVKMDNSQCVECQLLSIVAGGAGACAETEGLEVGVQSLLELSPHWLHHSCLVSTMGLCCASCSIERDQSLELAR